MWLPTAACRVVRSGGAALDFGRRRIFGYPALGHIADVRLDPIAHLGFRGSFGYQWGASEFGLSKFVTLDSRQVESIDQVRGISQRVEVDATPHWVGIFPHTPDHSALVGIPAEVA